MKNHYFTTLLIFIFMLLSGASFASPVTGFNVIRVDYDGTEGPGAFVELANGEWQQQTKQGSKAYQLRTRFEWVVHLMDMENWESALLDLRSMKVIAVSPFMPRSDRHYILRAYGPDNVAVTQVGAPPVRDCGGFFEAVCTLHGPRCDQGLIDIYPEAICTYASEKSRQWKAAHATPIVYRVLDATNPQHAKLLARPIRVELVTVMGNQDLTVNAKGADTILDLKRIFAKRYKHDVNTLSLSLFQSTTGPIKEPVPLENSRSLANYDFKSGTRLIVGVTPCQGIHCKFGLTIYPIKDLSNIPALGVSVFNVTMADTVGHIKRRILRDQFKPEQITLVFEGIALEDHRTLDSYGIGLDDRSSFIGAIYRTLDANAPAPVQQNVSAPQVASNAPAPIAEAGFGCSHNEQWRWTAGSVTVESDPRGCSPGAATSGWIIQGVAANALRATGVAHDMAGLLILTVDEAGQRLSLHINHIRSTAPNSAEFRYGLAPDSPLIGTGKWERFQR